MKALIVVDMLNDFIKEDGKLFCGPTVRDIVPVIKKKLQAAREAGTLIIYLCDAHAEDDKEFEKFEPHCIKGTAGAEIIEELTPADSEMEYIVYKTRYSGFYNTKLENILRRAKVDQAEVVGVCTNICVMDTVGDLANRDYGVLVDKTAVADFDQDAHASALTRMQGIYGATIVP